MDVSYNWHRQGTWSRNINHIGNNMDLLANLISNPVGAIAAVIALLSSASTLILIIVPTSKLPATLQPIITLLNKVAGNLGNNK